MAQSDQEILTVLADVVSEETGIEPAEVTPEKSFAGDLDIDSLSMMTILVNVEEKTGVAIPDEEMGEQVKAFVQPAPGVTGSAELEAELLAFLRTTLAGYKVPRSIEFVDALPRTETGKLQKHKLRDRHPAA